MIAALLSTRVLWNSSLSFLPECIIQTQAESDQSLEAAAVLGAEREHFEAVVEVVLAAAVVAEGHWLVVWLERQAESLVAESGEARLPAHQLEHRVHREAATHSGLKTRTGRNRHPVLARVSVSIPTPTTRRALCKAETVELYERVTDACSVREHDFSRATCCIRIVIRRTASLLVVAKPAGRAKGSGRAGLDAELSVRLPQHLSVWRREQM